MRLLKFVNGDAPSSVDGAQLNLASGTLSLPSFNKIWRKVNTSGATDSCYWLVDDNGKPVCAIQEVVLLQGDTSARAAQIISEEHIKGVDFRNKMGKALESSRADYGHTFKNATGSSAIQMNAEDDRQKRQERMKKDRTAVADQVEKGEQPIAKKSRKEK